MNGSTNGTPFNNVAPSESPPSPGSDSGTRPLLRACRCTTNSTEAKNSSAGIRPARMMLTYAVPTISAMMKAAAPMTGGMICPPVETTASMAPA